MCEDRSSQVGAQWTRAARAAWRELTGGPVLTDAMRPTLVAVSGGADSAALAIALATLAEARIVLGHVSHDQRPAELVRDDRVAVDSLGRRLGVRVLADHARCGGGNAEHTARVARYASLAAMARSAGCCFIATGHHGHDQAETLLLAMLRGGSADALRGIRRSRRLDRDEGLAVIRPALELTPKGAHAVCMEFGYSPRLDATNRDPARARAQLRYDVVPRLADVAGDLGEMLSRTVSRLDQRLGGSAVEERPDVGFEGFET